MLRPTLRGRTTLLVTALAGLALAVGAVGLVLSLRTQLTVANDDLLRTRVGDLLALAADGELPPAISDVSDEGISQVVDERGRVLAASRNIAGEPAVARLDATATPTVHTLAAPDEDETEDYRVWVASGPSPDGRATAYVGVSLESVSEATRTLAGALLVGVPLTTLLLAAAVWWVVGRALRRVDVITRDVDEITERALDRRVPESDVDDEVGRLASTMNRMLARLEEASARQRAFVADASHDLQSPLTAQRAQLEVALAHPEGVDGVRLAAEVLAVTDEMERLVRDLLFLATLEEEAAAATRLIDLDVVVLEEVARSRPPAGVRIDTGGVSAAPVRGDRGELQRLVRNLLDNALRHATSTVTLTTAGRGSTVELAVADDGPGVPAADRERIFQRFYRGDTARRRDDATGSGTGLGLAIARTVAERLDGTLALADDGPGARFVLRLPTAR